MQLTSARAFLGHVKIVIRSAFTAAKSDGFPSYGKSFSLCNAISLSAGFSIRATKRHTTIGILLRILYAICWFTLCSCSAGEITYFVKGLRGDASFLNITQVASCYGCCVLGICKMISLQFKRKRVNVILNRLEDMYQNIDDSEKPVAGRYIKVLMRKNKLFFSWLTFLICVFNMSPLFKTAYLYFVENKVVRLLPYLVWTPFDSFRPDIYPFMYLYHVSAGHISVAFIVGVDLLFVFLNGHVCMHFELLKGRISRIGQRSEHREYSGANYPRDDLNDELAQCVERHNLLIEICQEIESIFSFPLFVNVCGSSFLICLAGFQTTAVTGVDLFVYITFLIAMTVQIFQLCEAGHELIVKSVSLSDAVYECGWYNADLKFRRSVVILMTRTQKPLKLTAMRFSAMSLISFRKIISTAWSYFTLLQTIYYHQGQSIGNGR